MAEMTIRLETDLTTGKKNIIVSLASDADLLPHEHEEQHRALVEKLIEGGLVAASDVGKIVVQREEEELASDESPSESQSERESESGNA